MLAVFICFAVFTTTQALLLDLLKSQVCYDVIGCFSDEKPFTNSWRELPDSPKDVNVTLTLYTRANPLLGEALHFASNRSVEGTHFDLGAETKFITHGYMCNGTEAWVKNMTRAFLDKGAYNVIIVAWGVGAHSIYPKAVANTRVVGAVVAHFLSTLNKTQSYSLSRVHLLGHSLGAHISGYVGARVKGVTRITGMDPAGPLFESTDPAVRIDRTDADFVDCIHTDAAPLHEMGLGTMAAWCDVDFYPNGGQYQPGCPAPVSGTLGGILTLKVTEAENAVSCSHSRSHNLFTDSIQNCRFPSTPCDSYADFQAGKCTCSMSAGGVCPSMGFYANRNMAHGTYYLHTTGTQPFC